MRKRFMIVVVLMLAAMTVNVSAQQQPTAMTTSSQIDLLDLKNMDAMDVFKLISQKSGLNIVAGQNVQGRVTVYLKDIDVLEALHMIVEAYGWAYVKDEEAIKIMTAREYETKYGQQFGQNQETRIHKLLFANAADLITLLNQLKSSSGKLISDPKSRTLIMIDQPQRLDKMETIIARVDVPVTTRIFDLSYAKAEDLSGKISETLTPLVGKMEFDKRSNRMIVSDTSPKIKEVADIISAFDQKDREVLIEAKIVQVVLQDQFKMGVDWETIIADYHGMDLSGDFDILTSTEKAGKVTIGTLADDDYTAVLEILDTVGVTDILSSPSITVINNEEAKILVGSTQPYVTTTTTTPSSGPTTVAESVNFIEVGVKLFVTPTIHRDGFVTMKIKPEVSSVVSNLTTSNNNTIPIVETSEAETKVMVKDGVTLIIGGLIKEEKIKTTKKIPLLGDIPILGFAFRNVDDLVKKTEIVIFLTPKIITGDAPAHDFAAQ